MGQCIKHRTSMNITNEMLPSYSCTVKLFSTLVVALEGSYSYATLVDCNCLRLGAVQSWKATHTCFGTCLKHGCKSSSEHGEARTLLSGTWKRTWKSLHS